jgi:hypothetical protein
MSGSMKEPLIRVLHRQKSKRPTGAKGRCNVSSILLKAGGTLAILAMRKEEHD